MPDPVVQELLQLNQRLLESISRADWNTYQELCDPSLTAFEPEALGHLVEGMAFHRFYFELGEKSASEERGQRHRNTTMASPQVRLMGDVAVVAYVRLNQGLDLDGTPLTTGFAETRVWHRQQGKWKHVHFHRSPLGA
jgi:calcium/calmodulin-dependent protein kinase (CaM kinase) II